jgi:hypothetical protein
MAQYLKARHDVVPARRRSSPPRTTPRRRATTSAHPSIQD